MAQLPSQSYSRELHDLLLNTSLSWHYGCAPKAWESFWSSKWQADHVSFFLHLHACEETDSISEVIISNNQSWNSCQPVHQCFIGLLVLWCESGIGVPPSRPHFSFRVPSRVSSVQPIALLLLCCFCHTSWFWWCICCDFSQRRSYL